MKSLIDSKNETRDDLMCGYEIIQFKDGFRFSIDAVLLAHFASVKEHDIAADFCSGSGVVAFLVMAHKKPQNVSCVEIQPQYCDLIKRSITHNLLEDKIDVLCMDVKEAYLRFGYESLDSVLCNPPYLKNATGKTSEDDSKNIARREVLINLEDMIKSASQVLKNKGRLAIVHLAQRADEIFSLMGKYKLNVKRAQLIEPRIGEKPNLILVEGVKNSAQGIEWLPTLRVYDGDDYSQEIKDIYGL